MRIAMLSLHSSPIGPIGARDTGGMSVYVMELAIRLARRGHRMDLFTRRSRENRTLPMVTPLAPNVRLIHLEAHGSEAGGIDDTGADSLFLRIDAYAQALERFRRAEDGQYHIIHSNYWLSGSLGQRLKERWNRPHLITFHTLGVMKRRVHGESTASEERIAVERDLVRTATRILASTGTEAGHLTRHYEADPARIAIVPGGVDLTRFRLLDRDQCRSRLGFDSKERLALFVGRFDPMKGLDRFIDALPLLMHRPDFRAVVVGGDDPPSPAAEAVQARMRELNLQDRVHLAGRVPYADMPLYYNAADVVAAPSRYESFGLTALEAMACGTPVVGTPVGIMDRIVVQKKNGWRITGDSAEALARGVDFFISGAPRAPRREIRAGAAAFSWSHAVSALSREYATALETGRDGALSTDSPASVCRP